MRLLKFMRIGPPSDAKHGWDGDRQAMASQVEWDGHSGWLYWRADNTAVRTDARARRCRSGQAARARIGSQRAAFAGPSVTPACPASLVARASERLILMSALRCAASRSAGFASVSERASYRRAVVRTPR